MWIVHGPFDLKDETSSERIRKLLKTGTNYVLTRKNHGDPPRLQVNIKSVSKEHAYFTVSAHSLDHVTDLDYVPDLTLKYSKKGKDGKDPSPLNLLRAGDLINVAGGRSAKLESGDVVQLTTKASQHVEVFWHSIVVQWQPPKKDLASVTQTCAAIGMKLSHKSTDRATHVVLPSLALSDACLEVLLTGAAPVTRQWIDLILELANKPVESAGLDDIFCLPDVDAYLPPFEDTEAVWANKNLWTHDPARQTLLTGLRFIVVHDGGTDDAFESMLLKCGASACDRFDVRNGFDESAWEDAVNTAQKRASKAKAKSELASPLVVVVDREELLAVLGEPDFDALVRVLRANDLVFVASNTVRMAILGKKSALIECSVAAGANIEAAAGLMVAGTFDELEPSQIAHSTQASIVPETVPAARRSRRGTTPQASQVEDEDSLLPPPKTRVARRTARATSVSAEPVPDAAPTSAPAASPPLVTKTSKPTKSLLQNLPQPLQETQSQEKESGGDDIFAAPKRPVPPRKRGIRATSTIVSIGDDDDDASQTVPQAPPPAPVPTRAAAMDVDDLATGSKPPSARTSRKRPIRGGGIGISLKLGDDDSDDDKAQGDEPPLKKFKALFEGTEPSQPLPPGESLDFGSDTQSQSQAPSQMRRGGTQTQSRRLGGLAAVDEEEEREETASQAPVSRGSSLGTKRRRESGDEAADAPSIKRRALGTFVSTARTAPAETQEQSHQASSLHARSANIPIDISRKTGAVGDVMQASNVPVLTAIASTKRGRKMEDEFDREFNNLRISKPESEAERRVREEEDAYRECDFGEMLKRSNCWEVREYVLQEVADAEDGGFVPVRSERLEGRGKCSVWRDEWTGKADFKKFKKVGGRRTGGQVELEEPEVKDYGIGDAYWGKGSQSQAIAQSQGADDTFVAPAMQKQRALNRLAPVDSDDELSPAPTPAPSKARGSRSQKTATQSRTQSSRSGKAAVSSTAGKRKETPLFIDDSDDEIVDIIDDEDDDDMQVANGGTAMSIDEEAPATMAGTFAEKSQRATQAKLGPGGRSRVAMDTSSSGKRRGLAVANDDSDSEGATFRGFSKKKAGGKR